MPDQLILGGIAFDDFSTPAEMIGGGRQALVVHKLPGGQRVIHTLGPDEANVAWTGFFYGNNALDTALALDGMRAGGEIQSLTWGGQYRSVIVESFVFRVRKFPIWVNYAVSCLVYQNPMLGNLGGIANPIDTLILTDLSTASGL